MRDITPHVWAHWIAVRRLWLAVACLGVIYLAAACGGRGGPNGGTAASGSSDPISDICDCTPSAPESDDYRHAEKHVPLPSSTGQQISVSTILSWPQGPDPPDNTPRSGRENQEFFIPHAYLQYVWVYSGDCDIHLEISDSPSKDAPRAIVETPVDSEYCTARQTIQQQLAAHGITLSTSGQEINDPIPVQVLGLAFQDKRHNRGTQFVATVWELHPAIVTALQ